MEAQKKFEVHLQLSVFRSSDRYQVVNIESFDGLELPYIYAYGFGEDGQPILNPREPRFYEFNGSVSGHTCLNHPFQNGIIVKGKRIMGFDALEVMISNYGHGLGITRAEIEEKIKIFIDSKIDTIYFFKQSSVYGMAKPYNFKDSWIVSGKDAVLELDFWNSFLKSIGSAWRILTPKTRRLLRKLEYEKLKAEGL
jgi:hypothetical protein